jgi:hypothetical protein
VTFELNNRENRGVVVATRWRREDGIRPRQHHAEGGGVWRLGAGRVSGMGPAGGVGRPGEIGDYAGEGGPGAWAGVGRFEINSDNFQLFKKIQMIWIDLIKRWSSRFEKFQVKYGIEGFEERKSFLHRSFFKFELDFELKFREASRFEIR